MRKKYRVELAGPSPAIAETKSLPETREALLRMVHFAARGILEDTRRQQFITGVMRRFDARRARKGAWAHHAGEETFTVTPV